MAASDKDDRLSREDSAERRRLAAVASDMVDGAKATPLWQHGTDALVTFGRPIAESLVPGGPFLGPLYDYGRRYFERGLQSHHPREHAVMAGQALTSFYAGERETQGFEKETWARGVLAASTGQNDGLPINDIASYSAGPKDHQYLLSLDNYPQHRGAFWEGAHSELSELAYPEANVDSAELIERGQIAEPSGGVRPVEAGSPDVPTDLVGSERPAERVGLAGGDVAAEGSGLDVTAELTVADPAVGPVEFEPVESDRAVEAGDSGLAAEQASSTAFGRTVRSTETDVVPTPEESDIDAARAIEPKSRGQSEEPEDDGAGM